MNPTLKNMSKDYLKELLNQCTEQQQFMFKRMYSHKNLELPINEIVDDMDDDIIDLAVSQCEKTLAKKQTP